MSLTKNGRRASALFGHVAIAAAVTPATGGEGRAPSRGPSRGYGRKAHGLRARCRCRARTRLGCAAATGRAQQFQSGAPAPIHDYLGGESGMAAQQVLDFSVNKTLDGNTVKIRVHRAARRRQRRHGVGILLVPYFGACIHVPPPPPNQIVYVRMDKGMALDSIYEAYWITGKLKVTNKTTRLGAAAYQLAGTKIEIYKY
jgi:hypothetical protein